VSELVLGLLGAESDPELLRLGSALGERGARPLVLDLTRIPAEIAFHWHLDHLGWGDTNLLSLGAVYARSAWFSQPTRVPGKSLEESEAITRRERETAALLNAIVSELALRLPVVNPPTTYHYHRQKPLMYRVLERAGVPVPDFVVGSDLERAAYFVDGHGQAVVAKPLMGGPVVLADLAYLRHHHQEFDHRPLLLQRRILGRSLRGYVLGGKVIALAEIVHGDVVDWRSEVWAVRAVDASARVAEVAGLAARALGLVFAAVDLEEEGGAGGPPWVLDVNPSPMFSGFEKLSGLDVAGRLADFLVECAETHGASAALGPESSGDCPMLAPSDDRTRR
jgi:glutathione synthase/RimK-type ligase-like ATP-grasp enzyme